MKPLTLPIRRMGNDLFADIYCTCNNKDYAGTPIANIMKTKLSFSGYGDNYFFDVVNKEPQIIICECGMSYKFQWKRDGLVLETVGKLKKVK